MSIVANKGVKLKGLMSSLCKILKSSPIEWPTRTMLRSDPTSSWIFKVFFNSVAYLLVGNMLFLGEHTGLFVSPAASFRNGSLQAAAAHSKVASPEDVAGVAQEKVPRIKESKAHLCNDELFLALETSVVRSHLKIEGDEYGIGRRLFVLTETQEPFKTITASKAGLDRGLQIRWYADYGSPASRESGAGWCIRGKERRMKLDRLQNRL